MSSLKLISYYSIIAITFIIPSVLITQIEECTEYLSVYVIYLSLMMVVTGYNFYKHKINDDYFNQGNYYFYFRVMQILNLLFNVISMLYFSTKDNYCTNTTDTDNNVGFYFFTLFQIILIFIFIKKFQNINSQVQPEYELRLFLDRLKGRISKERIDECSICLYNINQEDNQEVADNKEEEIIILNCSHKFHYKCLNNCFTHEIKKCPLCRIAYID